MSNINDCRCILVIGSTSGLGRRLALSILNLPSNPTVIVCGRRQERLRSMLSSYGSSGRLKAIPLDVTAPPATLRSAVNAILSAHPNLDAVMFSNGTQHYSDFTKPESIDLDLLSAELTTNYMSIVNLVTLFLPHLIRVGESGRPAFLYTVSAGMAMIPGAWVANYSASKAALHSFTMSLTVQLKKKNVHVVEIMPPLVESEMYDDLSHRDHLATVWMPLDECTKQVMAGLSTGANQIPIGLAAPVFQKHEAGKIEMASKMSENHQSRCCKH